MIIDHEVFAVKPVVHEGLSGCSFALGDFVFVVGEDVVNTTRMDVEMWAKVFHAHGGAFDVPAGSTLAPWAWPTDIAVIFVPAFPEGEVGCLFFIVFVGLDADTSDLFFDFDVGEFAVLREFANREVDAAVVSLVGESFVKEFLDEFDHFVDVLGGGRIVFGRLDAKGFKVLKECLFVFAGKLFEWDACGPRVTDGFIIHIGEVHNLGDVIAAVLKRPAQDIFERIGAEVTDVGIVVDGRATSIHTDIGWIDRFEFLDGACEGIIKLEWHDQFPVPAEWMFPVCVVINRCSDDRVNVGDEKSSGSQCEGNGREEAGGKFLPKSGREWHEHGFDTNCQGDGDGRRPGAGTANGEDTAESGAAEKGNDFVQCPFFEVKSLRCG